MKIWLILANWSAKFCFLRDLYQRKYKYGIADGGKIVVLCSRVNNGERGKGKDQNQQAPVNGVNKIRLVNALDFENRTVTKVVPNHFEKYDYVISISSEKKGEVIFDKIFNSQNPRIVKDFNVFQGIVTGNNKVYLLTQEQIKENKIEQGAIVKCCG